LAQHKIEWKDIHGAWARGVWGARRGAWARGGWARHPRRKLGGVIASAHAGAHLDVTLRWHGSAGKPDDDAAPV
jgi:hypothetical protein